MTKTMDLVDLYDRTTAWTASKIPAAAKQLDSKTPCDEWKVKDLLNHIVGVQKLFEKDGPSPSGPPQGAPEQVISDDPAADYEAARKKVVESYQGDGTDEKAQMMLSIGVADQIVHGWDLAKATGQDATMPEDLAKVAFGAVNGRMDDDKSRGPSFKPQVPVPDDASVQDRLIGYMGRHP